jgi:hypothetical protein
MARMPDDWRRTPGACQTTNQPQGCFSTRAPLIVVLDTNALHGDAYAVLPTAQTFFGAAEAGTYEVWVPSVVVEELVRQFPERLEKLAGTVKKSFYEARALGLRLPENATEEDPIPAYRDQLTKNLTRPGIKIAGPPKRTGLIAEWIAQRRRPIPNDGRGAVDTQIWLTAVEAAEEDECILLAKNPKDFADVDNDRHELHPTLKADLEEFGLDEDAVELCPTILDFLQEQIEPDQAAMGSAQALLADDRRRRDLIREIESTVGWFPIESRSEQWSRVFAPTDVDDATITALDIEVLNLLRADAAKSGAHAIIEACGEATLDLALFNYEAATAPDHGRISVERWSPDEPMTSGSAIVSVVLTIEVLLEKTGLAITIDAIEPLDTDAVFTLFESWTDADHAAALAVVGDVFDVSGTQEAVAVRPLGVDKFYFKDGDLIARVEFGVDYRNPVDSEDEYMSAENVTEETLDLKATAPDFERGSLGEVFAVEGVFPD